MTPPEPVVLSWSGGKDSALALARLRGDAGVRVAALLTTVTTGYDRVSIHGVRRALLHAQAAALGLPVAEVEIAPASSNDAYEAAMAGGLAEVRRRWPEVRRLAFGDIFLEDVRAYREALAERHGFGARFPLWGGDTGELAHEVIGCGITARLVCVDTEALPADFAGRAYDGALLADLPEGVDPCGERGEFHTFVSAGPGFRAPVAYLEGPTVLRDDRWAYRDLLPA